MSRLFLLPCMIDLIVGIAAFASSSAFAQQVRIVKHFEMPDQWSVSFSRKGRPDNFEFDSVHSSEEGANQRVAALRAWTAHMLALDIEWKPAMILVEGEKKENGPVPNPPDVNSPNAKIKPNITTNAQAPVVREGEAPEQQSIAVEPPVFSKFKTDVEGSYSKDTPRIAGKRGQGTLGVTKVILDFDGDGTFKIKDSDNKPLNSGTWFQNDAVLTFATESYVYIGNVGSDKAKGLRFTNGQRLGSAEEEWNLELTTADPIVGTWQLASRKVGKNYGDFEEFYLTKLVLKLDHTASVEWVLRSKRVGWTIPEKITDFDRSTANWEVRDGKIFFTNPKVIRNWRGKDDQWSWFDPRYPLNVESLKTWERIK